MKLTNSLILKTIITFSSISLIYADSSKKIDYDIEIKNNTSQTLNLDLPVPAHTAAFIKLKSLKSQQELQDILHKAILNNSDEEIRRAVQAGANVDTEKEGKSPLLWAVLLNRNNSIETLLEYGAKLNDLIVQQAIKMKNIKSVVLFAEKDFLNFSMEDITGLIFNAKNTDNNSSLKFIHCLINKKYDANKLWEAIMIFMHKFGSNNCKNLINLLINNGGNLDHITSITNNGGTMTPLFFAISWNNNEAVKFLLESGANVNKKAAPYRNSLQTSLSYAISRNRSTMIDFLVMHGADL